MSYGVLSAVERGVRNWYLVGKGEHEGTSVLVTEQEILRLPPGADLAAALNRRFLDAHARRLQLKDLPRAGERDAE